VVAWEWLSRLKFHDPKNKHRNTETQKHGLSIGKTQRPSVFLCFNDSV
jgi:hypothetical protein